MKKLIGIAKRIAAAGLAAMLLAGVVPTAVFADGMEQTGPVHTSKATVDKSFVEYNKFKLVSTKFRLLKWKITVTTPSETDWDALSYIELIDDPKTMQQQYLARRVELEDGTLLYQDAGFNRGQTRNTGTFTKEGKQFFDTLPAEFDETQYPFDVNDGCLKLRLKKDHLVKEKDYTFVVYTRVTDDSKLSKRSFKNDVQVLTTFQDALTVEKDEDSAESGVLKTCEKLGEATGNEREVEYTVTFNLGEYAKDLHKQSGTIYPNDKIVFIDEIKNGYLEYVPDSAMLSCDMFQNEYYTIPYSEFTGNLQVSSDGSITTFTYTMTDELLGLYDYTTGTFTYHGSQFDPILKVKYHARLTDEEAEKLALSEEKENIYSNEVKVIYNGRLVGQDINETLLTASCYVVIVNAAENGTISADVTTAAANSTVTLTVAPDIGYAVADVTYTVNGETTTVQPVEGVYNFTMPEGNVTVSATFVPDSQRFEWTGENEYTIRSEIGWDYFCDLLADNDKGIFDGKIVKLGADIGTAQKPVTRMAGGDGQEFTGTFNGQGNTLTVSYENTGNNVRTAPFSYVDGATIQNLVVDGAITGTDYRAAGIVGETNGSKSIITNCVSHVNISGGRYTAGFSIGGNVAIEGCVFNGTINGTSLSGGFVGYSNSELTITNCLFAPQDGSSISGGTFYYNGGAGTLTNCYYTTALGETQGKQARQITPGDSVTLSIAGDGRVYGTSGITAYPSGIKYGDVYYAGSGDNVGLTLSAERDGYAFMGFTASAGTLTGSDTDGYSLTMPDEDVTVTAEFEKTYSFTITVRDTEHFDMIVNNFNTADPQGQATGGEAGDELMVEISNIDEGYYVKYAEYSYDGGETWTKLINNYFRMPEGNLIVRAVAEEIPYINYVTENNGESGDVQALPLNQYTLPFISKHYSVYYIDGDYRSSVYSDITLYNNAGVTLILADDVTFEMYSIIGAELDYSKGIAYFSDITITKPVGAKGTGTISVYGIAATNITFRAGIIETQNVSAYGVNQVSMREATPSIGVLTLDFSDENSMFSGSIYAKGEFTVGSVVIPEGRAMTDGTNSFPSSEYTVGDVNTTDSGTTITLTDKDGRTYTVSVTATFSSKKDMPTFGTPDFTLPEGLTTIEESAFEGDTLITVVDAGNCTSIGAYAFKGCTNLTQILLDKDCDIDNTAFSDCGTVFVFAQANGKTETFCDTREGIEFVAMD